MLEGQQCDKKSLRALDEIRELAKDAVAFANAQGGCLLIGIEDQSHLPPAGQTIHDVEIEKLHRRIGELTINLSYSVTRQTIQNSDQFIELSVNRCLNGPASTTDGKYLIREGDQSRPLRPDELMHFMTDRISFNWELQPTGISADDYDPEKWRML